MILELISYLSTIIPFVQQRSNDIYISYNVGDISMAVSNQSKRSELLCDVQNEWSFCKYSANQKVHTSLRSWNKA